MIEENNNLPSQDAAESERSYALTDTRFSAGQFRECCMRSVSDHYHHVVNIGSRFSCDKCDRWHHLIQPPPRYHYPLWVTKDFKHNSDRYDEKCKRLMVFLPTNAEVSHTAGRKPESEGMK